MALNPNIKKRYTMEHIIQMSFDETLQMLGVELVGYDPLGRDDDGNVVGALKRVTVNALGEYAVNDIEEGASLTYIGKEDPAGDWYIQKIDTSSGTSIRYATMKNNVATTTYTTAWTNRATLTFDTYSVAF